MGHVESLSKEVSASIEGVSLGIGRYHIDKQVCAPQASAADASGNAIKALMPSMTTYYILGKMPKAGKLVKANVFAYAVGVGASTVLDIMKVSSGTLITAGTQMVTQLAMNTADVSSNHKMSIVDASSNADADALIVAKITTAASETLTPPYVDLIFRL